MGPDQKELLDKLDFVWKAVTNDAARSSASNARGFIIGSFLALDNRHVSNSRSVSFLLVWNSNLEAFTSSAGLPKEAQEETEQAQGRVRNQFDCPSPNRKRAERPNACHAKSEQMDASATNQRGKAIGSCSVVEEDGGGRDKEDSNSALTGSCPDQEVVQEEATTPGESPCLDTCEA
jgi:hypothetical protein